MNAALFAVASLAAIEPPPPVQLLPFRCPELTDGDVRPPLTVELRERLLAEGAPLPPDVVTVSAICKGADVVLTASRPGFVSPPLRHIPLSNVQDAARPRAVALTIAELVRAVRRDGGPPTATVNGPPPPPAAEGKFWVATEVAPVLGVYVSAADHPLLGAQVRLVFGSGPATPPSPRWSFGGAYDLNVAGATFWSGRGEMQQLSVACSFIARRRGTRLGPELGLGIRGGRATFEGARTLGTQTNVWGGPFLSAAAHLEIGKSIAIRASVEIGFPIEGPVGYCDGSACVTFLGPWALTTIGSSVSF
jgi:hypothetical protein